MTKKNFLPQANFMGVKKANFDNARIIVIPIPYEGTVTYGLGTGNGPKAIIEASSHVEFYEDELDFEPYTLGIHTLPDVNEDFKSPDEMFQYVKNMTSELVKTGKLLIMLGGEHSITPALVASFSEIYGGISVLQLDAHADLRDSYNGSKYNHACAIRRVMDYCPAVQVGIRSLSLAEKRYIDHNNLPVFFMKDIRDSDWIDRVIEKLTDKVYITIDLDVFDPSIMPSVGTPEPDGMLWGQVTALLRKVSEKCDIVGFDAVELSPQDNNIAPDFLSAKLIYKLIGYALYSSEMTERNSKIMITDEEKQNMTYILQITDPYLNLTSAIKIDPEKSTSFGEILDRYVKVIDKNIMSTESAKNISIIQDCIYKIDDEGNLLDLYEGIILKHGDDVVDIEDETSFELIQTQDRRPFMLLDINIDRSQITEESNLYGYNIRKWKKNREVFENFVYDCIVNKYGSEVDRIIELSTNEDCKKFLRAVGMKIWESDFELYSRFIGDKIRFKDPSETLLNIIAGRGGTCTEKCSAMKLITDAYGIKSEYLLGGANAKGPFPEDALRRILEEMDFTLGKKYMLYWQHMALLYDLDGEDVMIDVTNGNIPFLFLMGDDIEELLRPKNKKSIKVNMVMDEENFYFHVVPQDIPENLLSAMQDWIEDVDLINVFDDGLGLLITKDYFVWPLMYHEDEDKLAEYDWWLERKKKFGNLELLDNFSLPGTLVNEFKEKYPQKFVDIVESAEYLSERYNESYRESADDPNYNVAFIFVRLEK